MAVFTNQATLSYNGTSVNSNIVTGNVVEVLGLTKTAVVGAYTTGGTVTYILSLTNTGATPLTGITVTDNLGETPFGAATVTPLDYEAGSVVYYQNGILQPTPTVSATAPLTFTDITVPAGGNATLVYEVRVNEFAPPAAGGIIQNTAIADGATLTAPVPATETVIALAEPILGITKALSPENVSENDQLTYTFTIQNSGNTATAATDNVTVTDTFNPILTDIIVTLNGAVLPPTAYTYDETTGVFATVPGAITVPAATYTQDPVTGAYTPTVGIAVLTVTGTV